jgi:hypothetical protein
MKTAFKIFTFVSCSVLLFSCAQVKGYERAHLNDEEMKQSVKTCAHFENYYQVIREGASGAGGGKTGGGCGCN